MTTSPGFTPDVKLSILSSKSVTMRSLMLVPKSGTVTDSASGSVTSKSYSIRASPFEKSATKSESGAVSPCCAATGGTSPRMSVMASTSAMGREKPPGDCQ